MVEMMKRQLRNVGARSVRNEFVRGLSSMLGIADRPKRRPAHHPMQSLKSDFAKIGADMYRVVERETAREKARRKASEPAE